MAGSTTTKAHTPSSVATQPVVPTPAATAFGVTISGAKSSAAAAPKMTKKKKRLIVAACAAPVFALLLWYQYRPVSDIDPQAANNPAVRQVVELEKKGDGNGLAQLTRSDDSAVARRAVSGLAAVGRYDALMDALKDRRPEVRSVAVAGLSNSNDPSRIETLAHYTQDPAPEVRLAAMSGIASTNDFAMFDHLIPMLSDPQPSVRRAALGAIQDRIGLQFPEFNPEGSESERAKGISRIRAMIPKMKQVFDRANQFDLQHHR